MIKRSASCSNGAVNAIEGNTLLDDARFSTESLFDLPIFGATAAPDSQRHDGPCR